MSLPTLPLILFTHCSLAAKASVCVNNEHTAYIVYINFDVNPHVNCSVSHIFVYTNVECILEEKKNSNVTFYTCACNFLNKRTDQKWAKWKEINSNPFTYILKSALNELTNREQFYNVLLKKNKIERLNWLYYTIPSRHFSVPPVSSD